MKPIYTISISILSGLAGGYLTCALLFIIWIIQVFLKAEIKP